MNYFKPRIIRFLSLMLALLMVLPMAFIADVKVQSKSIIDFYDMPDNWATEALVHAVNNGLLNGYIEDGVNLIKPNGMLRMNEMLTVITRAFGATVQADLVGLKGVAEGQWYTEYIKKAVQMGIVEDKGRMLPTKTATREEVFSALAKAFKLKNDDEQYKELDDFSDKDKIAKNLMGDINAMVKAGYLKGYPEGTLKPKASITRAEFATVMFRLVEHYITDKGTMTGTTIKGNLLVRSDNVILKKVVVKGDLIIADGVGDGEVILDDVKVEGRLVVRGGGTDSIIIRGNSSIDRIIVSRTDGMVHIDVEGDANVEIIYIDDGSDDVIVTGEVQTLEIAADNIMVIASNATIDKGIITGNNSNLVINKGSEINEVEIQAPDVKISGEGKVTDVKVGESGDNASIVTPSTKIQVDKQAQGVTGGGDKPVSSGTTASNNSTGSNLDTPVIPGGGIYIPPAPVEYTVVFKDHDGSVLKTSTIKSGENATPPANPSRTGYSFSRWDKPYINITADLTVTAQYAVNKYTITFDTDGGTDVNSITQDYNTGITAPPEPEKDGFTFAGWNPALPSTMPGENITITALWQSAGQHIVTFYTYDGFIWWIDIVDHGKAATPCEDNPQREGYTFTGWDEDYSEITSDLSLTAQYTVNQYTIIFVTDGDTEIDPITQDFGTPIMYPSEPEKYGYRFIGWFPSLPDEMPSENITVTAEWEALKHLVTFTDFDNTVLKTQYVETGSYATAPDSPSRPGYEFISWDKDFSDISSDLIVKAQYGAAKYSVFFNSNGAGEINPITDIAFEETIVLPYVPVRDNYIFAGWFSNNTLTNSFTDTTKVRDNSILHAKWIPSITHNSVLLKSAALLVNDEKHVSDIFTDIGDIYSAHISCNNSYVAEITNDGKIKGKNAGQALITVSESGNTEQYTLVVYEQTDESDFVFDSFTNTITAYIGTGGKVEIPETINNLSVSKITDSVFSGCSSLIEITIPKHVTTIGVSAFMDCINLNKIIFEAEHNLSIDDMAFHGCTNLVTVDIPSNVSNFGKQVFGKCYSLKEINVDEQNWNYMDISGVLFDFNGNELLTYPAGKKDQIYNLPASVTEIAQEAFWHNKSLAAIDATGNTAYSELDGVLYNSVKTRISVYPGGKEDESFRLPDTVESFDTGAFGHAYHLQKLSVTEQNPYYKVNEEGVIFSYDYSELILYPTGRQEKTYIVPQGTLKIADGAFTGCVYLETVDFISPQIQTKSKNIQLANFLSDDTFIGDFAFYGCETLVEARISKDINSIGYYAFGNCPNLKTVIFEASDKEISFGHLAFSGCSALTEFTIPKHVTSLGVYAFSYCTSLKTITFEQGSLLKDIPDSTFKECISLSEINNFPHTIEEIGYMAFYHCSELKNINIPDIGSPLTIGNSSFYWSGLEAIHIPDRIVSLGESAFACCYNLKEVTFGNNSILTVLEWATFNSCKGLKEIAIPKNIETIGQAVFTACDNLEKVSFHPDSALKSIGRYAFQQCQSLLSITIPKGVSVLEEWVFFSCRNLQAIFFQEESKINRIETLAFSGTMLTSINLPASLKNIDTEAFNHCNNLRLIEIGHDVTIADRMFGPNENNFKQIYDSYSKSAGLYKYDTMGNTWTMVVDSIAVEGIGISKSELEIMTYTSAYLSATVYPATATNANFMWVSDNTDIAQVNSYGQVSGISEGIVTITATTIEGNYSAECIVTVYNPTSEFAYEKLHDESNELRITKYLGTSSSVTIPGTINDYTVVEIGYNAFASNIVVRNVTLPDSVRIIGSQAFYNCKNLENIGFGVDSELVMINNDAFSGCKNLQQFDVPSNVFFIGDSAFEGTYQLQNINVANGNMHFRSVEGVLFNAQGTDLIAFPTGKSIKEYIMPDNVINIRGGAFNANKYIEKITINNLLDKIDSKALSGCSNLETFVIPADSQLSYIGWCAFLNCISLKSIEIPATVNSIQTEAFKGCKNLYSVTFRDHSCLTLLNYDVFAYCENMEDIIIPDSVVTIGVQTFRGCKNLKSITFSENSKLESIDYCAFGECMSLENITLPDSLVSIGVSVFSDCKNLESVVFSEFSNLTTIDEGAFRGTKLFLFKVPDQVVSIGRRAFAATGSLKSVLFTDSSVLTTIEEYAFEGSGLVTIDLPPLLNYIETGAFAGCNNLYVIKIGSSVTIDNNAVNGNNDFRDTYDGIAGMYALGSDGSWSAIDSITPVSAITLSQPGYATLVDHQFTLPYIIEPDNATIKYLEWSVDNTEIVEIVRYASSGTFAALKPGTVTITATSYDGTVSDSIEITIEPN